MVTVETGTECVLSAGEGGAFSDARKNANCHGDCGNWH